MWGIPMLFVDSCTVAPRGSSREGSTVLVACREMAPFEQSGARRPVPFQIVSRVALVSIVVAITNVSRGFTYLNFSNDPPTFAMRYSVMPTIFSSSNRLPTS